MSEENVLEANANALPASQLSAGDECYRLIKHWEKGPEFVRVDGVRTPWPRTEDGAALKAYPCSAGKWTIGFGVRWHPDGSPVVEGDTITEDQVMPYLEAAMGRVVADVRRVVTVRLRQNQFDAIVVWVYNLGINALVKSSELLPAINAGRWQDAAVSMGAFVYATVPGEDGYPWKRALKGLLIRRYSEGLVMLGYDWPEACKADHIALPTEREFQGAWSDPSTGRKGRYYDVVLPGKTTFSDVLLIAQKYPLQPATPAGIQIPSAVGDTADGTAEPPATSPASAAPPTKTATKEAKKAPEVKPAPPPAKPPEILKPQEPKPSIPLPPSVQVSTQNDMGHSVKSMYRSKRFWGGLLIIVGRLIIVADVTGTFAAPVRALIGDGVLMDWMTGVIVTMIGEAVLDRGEKKADGPIDTPKRAAVAAATGSST